MDKNMEDVDKRVEWLHSEQYSAAGDIFGEPQKTTRIGDAYQAQIPSLMTKNELSQLIALPVCHDAKTIVQNQFEFDLSIPVNWVHNQHKDKEETVEIQANAKGKSSIVGCGTDTALLPFPCSSGEESWSLIEHESFLLGLYIFGKNLRVVSKFMGNKGMPNVISYYYGKFYRSSEHKKWSMYRKKRCSNSVPGKKIFKGWRQQELLSHLLPNVTDDCKTRLTQLIRTFEEGKLLFEKYIFALRDTVGINLLVEAVAIGKGKRDLTSKTKTRLRNKKIQSRCSSLKTEEIVNILKDRIGLSKTRLNELFWEAVWPRLLARGWHSEELRNYASQNTKNSLVFLAPGVTKFSRRSLVKGSQYFDSLTEVLNKVASEPHLLEHEPDQDCLVEPHATHGSDDNNDLMKCTIVDTSLFGLVKVRELSSLTVFEPADMQASTSVSPETEYNTTEESQNEDLNHNTVEDLPDKKMDLSTDGQPIRKLKLVLKRKTKCQRINNIRSEDTSGEDEAMEDACSEKKRTRIVIDLNNHLEGPGSDDDNSLCSPKESVLTETTTNKPDLLSPIANGQRQSRRNRALTTKALEALENGFLNPKKKRSGPEDGARRHVRAKTALVSSCGARYLVDGVFNGSSQMVNESKMT